MNAVLRVLVLALVTALAAGCGQKGDLYRPAKPHKFAARADTVPGS